MPSLPSAPREPVVEAAGLRVTYASKKGPVEALRGLDLRIAPGSLFVLLGPNGAGKTTLMRCITSLARPSGGMIRVFGAAAAPEDRPARLARVGVLIENPGAYGRLDAREYLGFFGSFYRVSGLEARIEELCGGFGLALDGKRVAKLSQGNRQKLQLVRSLLHSPELLLWDEPTDHLDPEAQARVLGYLRSYLAASGATALVATHRLEQMEGLGTHFGFLREGHLVHGGTRDEVLADPEPRARFQFASTPDPAVLREAAARLGLMVAAGVAAAGAESGGGGDVDTGAVFSGTGLAAALPALVKALALADLPIRAVEPLRPTLTEVYGRAMA